MKYFLVEFGYHGQDMQASNGLCLPKSCTDEFVASSINSAFQMIKAPISVFYVKSDTENYEFPMNWVSYLTVFILLAIGFLVVLATTMGYKRKKEHKIIDSFNVMSNLKHFKVRENEDLNIWDGVRAFAMMWVVIGHTFATWNRGTINTTNMAVYGNKPFFLIIEAGILSVDVFLCLGGFFLAFIMSRNKITLKLCGLGIVQRALRIWPAYILVMMFYYSLYLRLGSSQIWWMQNFTTQFCDALWKEILFIANFLNPLNEQCLSWGWYLQVDFQLFIVGVFLLYLYSWNKIVFLSTSSFLAVGSLTLTFVYCQINNIKIYADLTELANGMGNFFDDIYTKPYGRCAPYMMGLILGVFIHGVQK